MVRRFEMGLRHPRREHDEAGYGPVRVASPNFKRVYQYSGWVLRR
jgi:hypothetical protein